MAWHAKPTYGYTKESSEAIDNATEVANQLLGYGWVLEAVCAALGNQEGESNYNPWRWQYEQVLPYGDPRIGEIGGGNTNHAYGLFQQDPAAKYLKRQYAMGLPTYAPNYADRSGQPHDGNAQVNYLHWICSDPSGGEWDSDTSHNSHNMPYADFIGNTQNRSVEYLTYTFFWGYERGTWGNNRVTAANYWYQYFSDNPPTPTPTGDASIWFGIFHALKKRKSNFYAQPRKRGGNFWKCLYRFKLKTLLLPASRRTAL